MVLPEVADVGRVRREHDPAGGAVELAVVAEEVALVAVHGEEGALADPAKDGLERGGRQCGVKVSLRPFFSTCSGGTRGLTALPRALLTAFSATTSVSSSS